jgi:hypothetical protein
MADNKGRLVRENQIKPADLLQDQMVRKILGYADDLSSQIQRFKGHVFDDVGSFLDLLAEKYDAQKGGRKGNMTFTTYDGLFQVKVSVADTLTFGPELQIAKNLIDGCIRDWSDGANDNVMALVQHAFRVDREGQVSREAIFALRKVQIDDSRWRGAMEAIADSIRVTGSKTYLRFYRRPSPTERWEQVTIDLASA